MPEMKTTLAGMLIARNNLMGYIDYPNLPTEVVDGIRDYFYLRFNECPTLSNNPDTLAISLQIASRVTAKNVYDLYNAYMAEYNPIENYRMTEITETKGHESNTHDEGTTATSDSKTTSNAGVDTSIEGNTNTTADTIYNEETTNKGVDKKLVSAYDTTKMSLHDENDVTGNTTSDSNTAESSKTSNKQKSNETSESEATGKVKSRTDVSGGSEKDSNGKTQTERFGNMGVTTTQQMLESSIALLQKLDFFEIVTNWIFEKSNAFYYLWF